jgi:hypothetical protein
VPTEKRTGKSVGENSPTEKRIDKSVGPNGPTEKRTGKDGKSYKTRKPRQSKAKSDPTVRKRMAGSKKAAAENVEQSRSVRLRLSVYRSLYGQLRAD